MAAYADMNPSSSPQFPAAGARFRDTKTSHTGTILYVGLLPGTKGTWLGVDWDDPSRGRHDGTSPADGVRYFTARYPTSGSYIRPSTSPDSYGFEFVEAMRRRYVEDVKGLAEGEERVILGSSGGAIEVEAVNLDKIRRNLSDLSKLREVSLADVRSAGRDGEIARVCPNIRGLDLRSCLIPSWAELVRITVQLPYLENLILIETRLVLPPSPFPELFLTAFQSIVLVSLTNTGSSWLPLPPRALPKLRVLELGRNNIACIEPRDDWKVEDANMLLEELNFDSNPIDNWKDAVSAIHQFQNLRRLLLPSSLISHIPQLDVSPSPVTQLLHVSLTATPLSSWQSIDNLGRWCPMLQGLRIAGCTLTKDPELGIYYRLFAIAKLPSLVSLDGAPIAPKERADAERFYISFLSSHPHLRPNLLGDPVINEAQSRWSDLCRVHDNLSQSTQFSGAVRPSPSDNKQPERLSSKLIHIMVYLSSTSPPDGERHMVPKISLRVLPTTPIRTLRRTISRKLTSALDNVRKDAELELWLPAEDGWLRIGSEGREEEEGLEWWGVEDGGTLWVYSS